MGDVPLRLAAALLAGVAALAGCGQSEDPPLAFACKNDRAAIEQALTAAPADVRLAGGVPLSRCFTDARSDADLQNVGGLMTNVAEDLEVRAPREPEAALRLGYLVGAARRGGGTGNGLQAELVRRLERSAALDRPTPEARRALAEGMRAGEARG
jgi:hypothetical protein